MRRLVICLLAIVALCIVPARAAVASHSAASIHGRVVFWNAYSTDEEKVLTTKVIPAFERKYPGVTVKNLTLPYNGMFTKILTALAGGTGPDVIRSDIIWVPQLANVGALMSFDHFSWFANYKKLVFKGALRTNYYRGHYYGLPLDTNTRVLVYSKPMFQQAGISGPPKTIKQFVADCAKIHALSSSDYCYSEGGFDAWNIEPWIFSFGGNITNSHYTTANGYMNGKKTLAAVNWLLNLYHKGYLAPNIMGGGTGTWDGFGKVYAMMLEGPWDVPILFNNKYPSSTYGQALVPSGPGGSSSVVGGEDIVVTKASRNKAADEAFVQFMLSKRAQTWMENIGQMSVLNSLAHSSKVPAYFRTYAKQLQTAKPRTPSPAWAKIDTVFTNQLEAIFRGNASPQDGLNVAAHEIDADLH